MPPRNTREETHQVKIIDARPFNDTLSLEQAADIARAWSLVHGFTTLLLDGRLTDILSRLPKGTDAGALLDAMLKRAMGQAPQR